MTATVSTESARAGLLRLRNAFAQAADRTVRTAAETTEAEAKATTAWQDRTGETRASINVQVRGRDYFVTAGGASRFLEWGTRAHIIRARNARALRFVSNGQVFYRAWVSHPGTKATHFLELARNRGEMAAAFAADLYLGEAMAN